MTMRVRWMTAGDLQTVAALESIHYEDGWDLHDLGGWFGTPKAVGVVAENNGVVVGYLVAVKRPRHLEILCWSVVPAYRRKGLGRALFVFLLKTRSELDDMRSVTVFVRDSALDLQLFLRALGFTAIRVLPNECKNGDDAYLFSWYVPSSK